MPRGHTLSSDAANTTGPYHRSRTRLGPFHPGREGTDGDTRAVTVADLHNRSVYLTNKRTLDSLRRICHRPPLKTEEMRYVEEECGLVLRPGNGCLSGRR